MSILDNCCNVVMLCFSAVAWQITLSHPENQKETSRVQGHPDGTNSHEADLCVLLFRSLISSDRTVIPTSCNLPYYHLFDIYYHITWLFYTGRTNQLAIFS